MPAHTLVLASSSPRRKELLARIVDDFAIEPADIDETPRTDEPAEDYVVRLALEKAVKVAAAGRVVVGADTVVVLDGEILGKPTDDAHSAEMLRRLSGRSHFAMTGVAVVVRGDSGADEARTELAVTEVQVRDLDAPMVDWYVATGEGADKAGAYGLQGRGAVFADVVDGSVSNVIGLPIPIVFDLLREVGVILAEPGTAS